MNISDTDRIDWLEKNGGNISSTPDDTGTAVFNVCAYASTEWAGDYATVRDAIDAAMELLQSKDLK